MAEELLRERGRKEFPEKSNKAIISKPVVNVFIDSLRSVLSHLNRNEKRIPISSSVD